MLMIEYIRVSVEGRWKGVYKGFGDQEAKSIYRIKKSVYIYAPGASYFFSEFFLEITNFACQ